MKFTTVFLVSFLTVAFATPLGDNAARDVDVEARAPQIHCDALPFLACEGGIDQQIECQNLGFQCSATGSVPIISDTTCASQCVCDVPCPQ
ncbi:hypothetical protein C8R44DRAFT_882616 [Mycena epipterygia]|nr:hypothetical protein C8R44DRAFT_882616 [Mycena epipterygia]